MSDGTTVPEGVVRGCATAGYQVEGGVSEGVPLKGYFVWSLLDNFEWFRGYEKRFGLIYVNYYNDLRRVPKLSAHYFREVCRRNAAV